MFGCFPIGSASRSPLRCLGQSTADSYTLSDNLCRLIFFVGQSELNLGRLVVSEEVLQAKLFLHRRGVFLVPRLKRPQGFPCM